MEIWAITQAIPINSELPVASIVTTDCPRRSGENRPFPVPQKNTYRDFRVQTVQTPDPRIRMAPTERRSRLGRVWVWSFSVGGEDFLVCSSS